MTKRASAKLFRPLALVALLVCVGAGGCRERPAALDSAEEAGTDARVPAAVPAPTAAQPEPEAQPPADGCIRGGTPRAQVRALMGEPDSISFGTWLYGRSSIDFGYGVVVAYANVDGRLILC